MWVGPVNGKKQEVLRNGDIEELLTGIIVSAIKPRDGTQSRWPMHLPGAAIWTMTGQRVEPRCGCGYRFLSRFPGIARPACGWVTHGNVEVPSYKCHC